MNISRNWLAKYVTIDCDLAALCEKLTMLEARVLGGDTVASAWGLAFAIPNTFRRMLGEGALGTALIPLVSETEAKKGPEQVRRELGVVFSVLSLILAAVVVLVTGIALGLYRATFFESVRHAMTPEILRDIFEIESSIHTGADGVPCCIPTGSVKEPTR